MNGLLMVKGRLPLRPAIPKKILLIQLGDIGDVVWATPTFHAVKSAFPDARLSVLLRAGNGSLVAADPSISRVFEVSKPRDFKGAFLAPFRLLRALRREHFDWVVDLRSDERGAYMAFFSGAPVRIALDYPTLPWRNHFFTHLAPQPPIAPPEHGAAEQSLCVVRGIGIQAREFVPRLWISDATAVSIEALLRKDNLWSHPWISINPFSRWSYKELPPEKWTDVMNWFSETYSVPMVLVGSPQEAERAATLAKGSRGDVRNYAGRTTLLNLPALLDQSRMHIGVDSAAPHIASAVGTPTITVFGPTDWRDWVCPGRTTRVVASTMACAPCWKKGCDHSGKSLCLESFDVDVLKDAIRDMMADIGGLHGSSKPAI